MKYINILPVVAIAAMFFYSCYDDKMDWYRDSSWGDIDESEIPLQLKEKIERYDVLNAYATYTLGVGISLDLYMNDDTYRTLVNENFDEIALGYEMKHGALVNNQGEINFASVDNFIAKLKTAGLTVYGHTLVWHSNQNAYYLNSLIEEIRIPAPDGKNILPNGSFEDGMTGWGAWGSGTAAVTTETALDGTHSLKATSSDAATQVWSLQVQSPEFSIIEGHRYQITFCIKSDVAGAVRLSFEEGEDIIQPFGNAYPPNNASDGSNNTISTGSSWKQIKYDGNNSELEFVAAITGTTQFRLDLGTYPDVTYFIDYVFVIDLDELPENLISNGTFENGISGWSAYNGSGPEHVTGEYAYEGNGAMKVVNETSYPAEQWRTQIHTNFKSAWEAGKDYRISFMIRSEGAGSVRCSTTNVSSEGAIHYQGDQNTSSSWQQIIWDITAEGEEDGFNFDLGAMVNTYYIDNVFVYEIEEEEAYEPIMVLKTDEEKAEIIGEALQEWIYDMVTHFRDDVKAWDVVNEPMDDGRPYELKTGVGKEVASDEFYWQDYLGKDYAVTAFNLARQYGNPDDILFINDYNLEYNLNKCEGLIQYVQYIESQGAQVDGIGTQMHISIDTSKENIAQMFQKLAATGKLIKVSELDVQVGTASPTTEQLAEQAEMYQYIADMYNQYIPEAQRYGITVWGISDNAKEHEYWLPDDAPNLWDKNYERKHAYKGFADGLAGKDVSEDFTGELQY